MSISPDIAAYYEGKTVLVTGGTGSIGSIIVEELLQARPRAVRVFSRDEGKHFDMQERFGPRTDLRYLVGDVRDAERLRVAMKGVDAVFHAAALKHVPACEYNPFEAVKTNVLGTQNVITCAVEARVRTVVAVSTDKAMTPVNTMGASKLLAEKLVAAADSWNPDTTMCCVRFGNVVGSRGSVVPAWINSIRRQREVRVTEPEMTRFMMSIRDAVHLTLKAGVESRGGEIFIFKMPVLRLDDLLGVVIEETCRRSGIDVSEVSVSSIGLRAGEKMHEGLISEDEVIRSEDRNDMIVVHSIDEFTRRQRTGWGDVDTSVLHSDKVQVMSRDQIAEMLASSGVWVQAGLE